MKKKCSDCRTIIPKYKSTATGVVLNTNNKCTSCSSLGPKHRKATKARYCRECNKLLDADRYFKCRGCIDLDADDGELVYHQVGAGMSGLAYGN